MPLKPVTREFLALVERETGYPVRLVEEPKLPTLARVEVQKIGYEIALLGMSGIDVNDPEKQYALRSLDGEFTGLHLVCLEYVAFKQVAPEMDIGFDLAREYEMAERLYEARRE